MVLETIAPIARNLVPPGLIVALVLFLALAIRSKTIGSLQAELSIFLTIWVVAELLRVLGILNLIGTSPTLQLITVTIHTLSMVAFGLFILFRFYRVSKRGR
ncbi:MAG: hypothetical protein HYU03_06370 [Thaumarchaeota archaeon]|nr:hypothetical protein [Nitrososphaerota archaeon]MCS4540293.1 hypothetical protein [Nitrososphaerota archaeon]